MDLSGSEVPRVLITCRSYTTLEIIDGDVFDILHDEDAVSLCCLGILRLVLLGVEAKRKIPDYWLLRLANDRVGNLPAVRLTPDETEARSNMWISNRAYFDGDTSKQQLLLQYWYANKLANSNAVVTWSIKLAKPDAGADILNRGKREQRPSFYKRTPYTKQPPTTILPKQRVNKNKKNVMKDKLSPFNLGNAFDDENEGGGDVIFLGGEFTGNYLVYENVDPHKGYLVPVTFWQQLVPHLCMSDIDSRTPMGWLSGEHMNA
nr:hypothetical protein [Tanacetum cinerariifolium]